jgi:hypothetical protein
MPVESRRIQRAGCRQNSQRLARGGLLQAGAQWRPCRSARSAMWALYEAGVPFRTIIREDGTLEHWTRPELPPREVPKHDPHERRPRAPEWDPEGLKAEIVGLTAAAEVA